MDSVDQPTAASLATPIALSTLEHAVLNMDSAEIRASIVGLAAYLDVLALRALRRLHQRRQHQVPKNQYWERLRLHQLQVLILPMGHVVLEMGILFAVTGPKDLAVHCTG